MPNPIEAGPMNIYTETLAPVRLPSTGNLSSLSLAHPISAAISIKPSLQVSQVKAQVTFLLVATK
jgi:hypothetical protein